MTVDCRMRLILLLATVLTLALMLLALIPLAMQEILEIVVSVVTIGLYVLVVAIAFSIASLVFFALCLRLASDDESLTNPRSYQHQFWMWTGAKIMEF